MNGRRVDLRCPRCRASSFAPAGTTCELGHKAVAMKDVSLKAESKLGGVLPTKGSPPRKARPPTETGKGGTA